MVPDEARKGVVRRALARGVTPYLEAFKEFSSIWARIWAFYFLNGLVVFEFLG